MRGRISREKIHEGKETLKEYVENRKKKKEEEEEELKNLRNEREVWEFINRKRKGEEENTEEKGKLIQEREEIEVKGRQKDEEDREDELKEEEIIKTIDKSKRRKDAEIDEISAEAWKCGGQAVRKGIMELWLQI